MFLLSSIILSFQTLPEDLFNLICVSCSNKVDSFHSFFQEIHEAQRFFNDHKSLVTPEIKIEDDVFEEVVSQEWKIIPEVNDFIDEGATPQSNDPDFEIKEDVKSEDEDTEDEEMLSECESEEEDRVKSREPSKKRKEDRLINGFFDFVCQQCKIKLQTWTKYRKHMRKKHNEKRAKIFCCNNSIDAAHLPLLGHFYYHTDPDRLKCISCDKQYNNLKSLSQHTRKVHSHPKEKKEEPKVSCPECGISLVKRCLPNHLKIHQPRVKLQCDICKKFLQSRKAMLYHMTQQHLPKNPNIDQILCNICAKSFTSKDRFNHHLRYHHDDTTGKCPECDVVMRLENLRVHRKRVHEIKKVSCPICAKEFKVFPAYIFQ